MLPFLTSGTMYKAEAGITSLHLIHCRLCWFYEKNNRKGYTYWRQVDKKPDITLGCPMMML